MQNKQREAGYYWCSLVGAKWEILYWEGECWEHESGFDDTRMDRINETRILSPDEVFSDNTEFMALALKKSVSDNKRSINRLAYYFDESPFGVEIKLSDINAARGITNEPKLPFIDEGATDDRSGTNLLIHSHYVDNSSGAYSKYAPSMSVADLSGSGLTPMDIQRTIREATQKLLNQKPTSTFIAESKTDETRDNFERLARKQGAETHSCDCAPVHGRMPRFTVAPIPKDRETALWYSPDFIEAQKRLSEAAKPPVNRVSAFINRMMGGRKL